MVSIGTAASGFAAAYGFLVLGVTLFHAGFCIGLTDAIRPLRARV